MARDATSGPSVGSRLMRFHTDGATRRTAYTYCAVPPMRSSIVAGVVRVYDDSACANSRRSLMRAGQTPMVTAS